MVTIAERFRANPFFSNGVIDPMNGAGSNIICKEEEAKSEEQEEPPKEATNEYKGEPLVTQKVEPTKEEKSLGTAKEEAVAKQEVDPFSEESDIDDNSKEVRACW